MQPKISVLVPFYNCEKYIAECIESIAKQSFTDYEIIFLDDGSTDKSAEIVAQTVARYSGLSFSTLRNSRNQGIAFCRNRLLDSATGQYILFVDADDRIEPDMLDTLYQTAISEGADITVSDIFYELPAQTIVAVDSVAATQADNLRQAIEQKIVYTGLWNKLILSELIKQPECRFAEGLNMSEDRLVVIKLYYFASKIAKVDKPLYHYNRTNMQSITYRKTEYHYCQSILFWQLLDEFLIKHNLYDTYRQSVEYSKVENKVLLMQQAVSLRLYRKYSSMFADIQSRFIGVFPYRSQNLTLYLACRRLLFGAYVINLLLRFKIFINNILCRK
jgi:glycosyltransferase